MPDGERHPRGGAAVRTILVVLAVAVLVAIGVFLSHVGRERSTRIVASTRPPAETTTTGETLAPSATTMPSPDSVATTEPEYEPEPEATTMPGVALAPVESPAPDSAAATNPSTRPRRLRRRPTTVALAPVDPAYIPGDAYVPPAHPLDQWGAGAAPAGAAGGGHLTFTPDAKLLYTSDSGATEYRDIATGQHQAVGAKLGDTHAMAFTPDGRSAIIASAGGDVRLFNASTWQSDTSYASGVAGVSGVAITTDGRLIAFASPTGVVVWDTVDKKPRTTLAANEACTSAGFSADGKLLVIGASAGATVYDTTFWQKQATLPGGAAAAIKFWPARGTFAAAGADHVIRIYDMATNQVTATLAGYPGAMSDFALSPDGRTVAACGAGGVVVWDSTAGAARKLP